MSANQSERLAGETEEQREPGCRVLVPIKMRDWLPRLKNRERPGCRGHVPIEVIIERLKNRERPDCSVTKTDREQQQPQLPLLEQPSVQARCHSQFSTLDVPTCTTCSQRISWPQILFKFY